jgi:hypothetical protein
MDAVVVERLEPEWDSFLKEKFAIPVCATGRKPVTTL